MGFLGSLLGGGSKSKTNTTANQTTTNTDRSQTGGDGSIQAQGDISIESLDTELAANAINAVKSLGESGLDLSLDTTRLVLDNNTKLTESAFDLVTTAGLQLTKFNEQAAQDNKYTTIKNQELAADLARRSFEIANPVQASADNVFSFAKVALVTGAAALAAILFLSRPSKN